MSIQIKAFLIVLVLAVFAGSYYGVYRWGKTQGAADEKALCAQKQLEDLQGIITGTENLVAAANTASLVLGKTINEREVHNAKTTEAIYRALHVTQPTRIECVFTDDIMRLITHAANRADHAAATGLAGDLPGSTAPK